MVSEECTTDEGGGISWLGLKGGGGRDTTGCVGSTDMLVIVWEVIEFVGHMGQEGSS